MIDHVSVPVSDLGASAGFYAKLLAPLGYAQLVERPATIGFGKKYPEFWINRPLDEQAASAGNGAHFAFFARGRAEVDAFHAAALAAGGTDNGPPGPRPHYHATYYAAFVLDPDGHNIEAVFHG